MAKGDKHVREYSVGGPDGSTVGFREVYHENSNGRKVLISKENLGAVDPD